MRQHLYSLAACLIAAGVATVATGARAQPSMLTTIQIRVSSKGLDLTTEAGATQFLDRLSRAASAACGGYPDPSPIITDAPRRFRLCREKAVAGAVAQSQSELLKRQLTIREADGKVRMARR